MHLAVPAARGRPIVTNSIMQAKITAGKDFLNSIKPLSSVSAKDVLAEQRAGGVLRELLE